MAKTFFIAALAIIPFATVQALDQPSGAQLQELQSPPGVAESTEDPRFLAPAQAPSTFKPVKDLEGQEIDEELFEEIKSRQLPPNAEAGARVIQAPRNRQSSGHLAAAPVLGTNFDGFSILDAGYFPPDPIMAAGPNHLIVAVNLRWRIFSKDGTPGFSTTFQSWFASVNTLTLNYSDPKVLYDQYAGRWMVMCIGYGSSTNRRGAYFVSVSDDSDPNGTWYKWMVTVPNDGSFPDFPGVGYDASEAFYFSGNHFGLSSGSFLYDGVMILKKSELYANNAAVPPLTTFMFTRMRDGDGGLTFTIKPSLNFGSPLSGNFLVNTQGSAGTNIELWRITNPTTAPVLSKRASIPIGAYSAPPNAAQLGDSNLIETNSSTIQSEVQYREGNLFFTFPHAYNFGSGTVSAVRYLQIDTAGTIVQNIIYGADGEHFFFPAPLASGNGNAAMVFSHSSSASYCGARYVGNFPGDPVAEVLKDGEGPYFRAGSTDTRNRWGDYGGISSDPSFPRRIWMYHEYAGAGNIWKTHCGEIVLQNQAPEILGPAVASVNEQDTLTDTLRIWEPDGESLFVSFSPLPPYANLTDIGGGKKELKLTPGCYDVGLDTISIIAADNADPALADTLELIITVMEHNCRPTAGLSGPDTVVLNQCQTFSLPVFATDPDSSGAITFSVSPLPAFASVTDSGGGKGALNLAPTTADLGLYSAQVFASDGQDSSGVSIPVRVFDRGDMNRDGSLAPADVVLLLNCVFLGMPPAAGLSACDLDGNGGSLGDVVLLINTLFLGDPMPPCS